MLSKSTTRATALALALFAASCARWLPWKDDVTSPEVNLAFTLHRNLVELQTLRLNDRPGRFLLGSAAPRTVLDPAFAGNGPHALQLTAKNTVKIRPFTLDLGGVADGIIGADMWSNQSISIDYRSGLVTLQKQGIETGLMTVYRYDAAPAIDVTVDGALLRAIVDTTSPDTLVLPSTTDRRGTASVTVAGTDFGPIDVRYANVTEPRIGNRLLSRFLVSIDYGKKVVGLWRDPRIPLAPAPIP
ncbi:MAG: hypothetical protein QOJ98_1214, partial [Acidobacteriota bacterium]|nr:hypothetical protein [Acidobacteriota bacterium]